MGATKRSAFCYQKAAPDHYNHAQSIEVIMIVDTSW